MTKNKFFGEAVTYLVMLSGLIFGAHFFQRIKFEFKNNRPADPSIVASMSELGLTSKKSNEQLYKEMIESNNSDDWENIRGPRPEENNLEYKKAKEKQQKEREKQREERRKFLSESSSFKNALTRGFKTDENK
ncbi:hypothetical protein Mgra_00002084 [Meloidogyne graminicola]|uniref:Cytochrome c oxidase assembly protein COX16 homolog, mitochondrial n=1 Tax=Meloidogyne graminicola TaxID=189291 RepID=A0A8S9ZZU1_9BILA|nr:hypothetical protein Mgra_00002084 [Meloidogyne graminicola]